jgi:signal transduction histidine kinase
MARMASFRLWLARWGQVALVVVITVLVPVLAILQYRWTGELSDLEQLRARSNLSAAARQFSARFDGLLAVNYAEAHRHLTTEQVDAAPPRVAGIPSHEIVRQVLRVDHVDGRFDVTALDARWQPAGAVPWPAWLDARPNGVSINGTPVPRGLQRTLLDEVPALVVRPEGDVVDRWLIVELDLERITRDLLPAMLAGCMEGGIPVEYDVLIRREDGPDDVLYRSRAGLTDADFRSWVTWTPLFAVHSRDLPPRLAPGLMPDAAAHRWRLFVKPRDGALEAAVMSARGRNRGAGAGVLALLVLSMGLLMASMHRLQRGARDQLALVARISHELRTPLATITCAGGNLADDVVACSPDTREYGRIIQREGRRLNQTIADILMCCRLQAPAPAALTFEASAVPGIIHDAVADAVAVTGVARTRVTCVIDPAIPPVIADAYALRMAIKNLLVNAVRHGEESPVVVSAGPLPSGAVQIVVEDGGPGIPADEVPRVFDSFFRGRRARSAEIEGSGIGLSVVYHVVRSHGGKVQVSRGEPQGTRVTVTLPAAAMPAMVPGETAA